MTSPISHHRQVISNNVRGTIPSGGPLRRHLGHNSSYIPYSGNIKTDLSVYSDNVRMWFLAIVEFLTLTITHEPTKDHERVVCFGFDSSPGGVRLINLVAEYFPQVNFYVYVYKKYPWDFKENVSIQQRKNHDNINEYNHLGGLMIYYFYLPESRNDLRNWYYEYVRMYPQEVERIMKQNNITKDDETIRINVLIRHLMLKQLEMYLLVYPRWALLRFYPTTINNAIFKYVGGTLILPCYGEKYMRSCFMITNERLLKFWDLKLYYGRLQSFNLYDRAKRYPNLLDVKNLQPNNFDRCHDCSSYVFIIQQYLLRFGGEKDDASIISSRMMKWNNELSKIGSEPILEPRAPSVYDHLQEYRVLYNTEPPVMGTSYNIPREINYDSVPLLEYKGNPDKKVSTLHWGQRKLFLSELEFLTEHSMVGDIILYIGSAPGDHIPFLMTHFPGRKWVLYDPRDFNTKLTGLPDVEIVNNFFTEKDVEKYKSDSNKILFISDIRRDTMDESIKEDNELQESIYLNLKPRKALLKFRLPYDLHKEYEYIDGRIMTQCWQGSRSIESRLIPYGTVKRIWNTKQYEDLMFSHNTYFRLCHYPHRVNVPGLDDCYDCASEVHIWRNYLLKYKRITGGIDRIIAQKIIELNQNISNVDKPHEALRIKHKIEQNKIHGGKKSDKTHDHHEEYRERFGIEPASMVSPFSADFPRVLDLTKEPEFHYVEEKENTVSTIHWGQRKLFIGELEFLTKYSKPGDIILYIGSASGIHIPYLTELFPNRQWILYDPSDFDPRLHKIDDVIIHNSLFTDSHVEEIIASNVSDHLLFISDIRNDLHKAHDDDEQNEMVWNDNIMQMNWHLAMKPRKSMLKFRLPFSSDERKYEYLDGDVMLQCWPGSRSTETRLIPYGDKMTVWNSKQYEGLLYTHNIAYRMFHYPHHLGIPGMDDCYDCSGEIHVWYKYLQTISDEKNIEEYILKLNREIGHGRDDSLLFRTKNREKYVSQYEGKKTLPVDPLKITPKIISYKSTNTPARQTMFMQPGTSEALPISSQEQLKQLYTDPYYINMRNEFNHKVMIGRFFYRTPELGRSLIKYTEELVNQGLTDNEIYRQLHTFVHGTLFKSPEYLKRERDSWSRDEDRAKDIRILLNDYKEGIDKYLDVGCKEGSLTKVTGDVIEASEVIGVDIVDIPDTDFDFMKLDDPYELTFDDDYFDLVTAYMMLHHVEDMTRYLQEVHRVLKKGGILLVREHDCQPKQFSLYLDIYHGLYAMVWEPIPETDDFSTENTYYWTKENFIREVSSLGFRLTHDTDVKGSLRYFYAVFEKI